MGGTDGSRGRVKGRDELIESVQLVGDVGGCTPLFPPRLHLVLLLHLPDQQTYLPRRISPSGSILAFDE